MDPSCRAFVVLSTLLVIDVAVGTARALEGSKVFTPSINPLVVKIEGRKGTRLYRPDPDEAAAAAEWEAAHSDRTAKDKLDDCLEREIKNNE